MKYYEIFVRHSLISTRQIASGRIARSYDDMYLTFKEQTITQK